ncbi:MAG: type I-E CRISPR-associated protein Cse1/CasA [Chitinivibrionales bacterium]
MSRYNLVDEQWIPVIDLKGNRKELGILETLLNAEELATIEDPSPLVTASLHRFLLAVLYRAIEGPCDPDATKQLFREGLPKEKIRNYLKEWHDRFWLFNEKYPFAQVPYYEPTIKNNKQKWRAWTVLAAEHNADNAKVLFDHVDIFKAGILLPKQAVKWLLSCNTFALGGGNSDFQYVKDAPSASSIMAIPIGQSLMDTLIFCLTPQNREVMIKDVPIWEAKPESIDQLKNGIDRVASGYADIYTWRSRSIKFDENPRLEISKIAFASGIGYLESTISDPMVGYRLDPKLGKLPFQFKDRGFWRDFDSLLPDESGLSPTTIDNCLALTRKEQNRIPRAVIVLGQANNKAKIEFWRMEQFALPKGFLRDHYTRSDIRTHLQNAENVSKSLYSACAMFAQLLLSRGNRKVDKKDIKNFLTQMPILSSYWSTLESNFHKALRDYAIDKNPDEIHHDWLIAVREALRGAWNLHQTSISGSDAWAIRAFVNADKIIKNEINGLNLNINKLKEVP